MRSEWNSSLNKTVIGLFLCIKCGMCERMNKSWIRIKNFIEKCENFLEVKYQTSVFKKQYKVGEQVWILLNI